MIPAVDCDKTPPVARFVGDKFIELYPSADDSWLMRVFGDIDSLFAGRNPAFLPVDLRYHNLRHTLLATVCMALLLEGQRMTDGEGSLKPRDFELGIAGVLLHDTGYMKLRSDTSGTGAKYTFCHILRSCAFAASYLPEVGVTDVEIENVLSAINCTGPNSEISRLRFRDPVSRVVGCDLATADYLGQLADPLYPDKLGELYLEFAESDDFSNVPPERRIYRSEEDLICRTPAFWRSFVKPKLDNDFQAVYRYLARPVRSDHNEYTAAVEANFANIEGRIASIKAAVG